MTVETVVASTAHLADTDLRRMTSYGLWPRVRAAGGLAPSDAVRLAAEAGVLVAVTARGEAERWRREGEQLLTAATATCAHPATPLPIAVVVLPATSPPRPGPVAVLSPAESVSAYEVYIGAALASATGRRVEHLNARGAEASAGRSRFSARAAARAAVTDWQERVHDRPVRALHTLRTRPAVVVVPVPPGPSGAVGASCAAQLVADHPDSDVVLVLDAAHARYGPVVAHQVASLVESAVGVETAAADNVSTDTGTTAPSTPTVTLAPSGDHAGPADDGALPAIRASDVVHVRLTNTGLELTNHSPLHVRVRVGLGSGAGASQVRAMHEALLEPGDCRSASVDTLPGAADLTPPAPVIRHWSHGSAEVYQGGERRMVELRVAVLDAAARERASGTYRPGNGLDFSLPARDLLTLIGRTEARVILPEPARTPGLVAPPQDLWAALQAALAVGASMLERRTA